MSADPGDGTGLPVGAPVEWSPREVPVAFSREGDWCWVAPLGPEHDAALFGSWLPDPERFTYLPWGPFDDQAGLTGILDQLRTGGSFVPFAIGRRGHGAEGMASLLRVDRDNGVVEVGAILYGTGLAGTPATTEAMYFLAEYVFESLGYRRYEWKCDSLNAASRRTAERLGFRYEGTFRQSVVYKGRNRDTAWFSVTDGEWPLVKRAMETWLRADNVSEGSQLRRLEEIRAALDPGR